jgi:ABC-2 type transport system permease protein
MLLLSLPLAGVYIGGVAAVYPTASARAVIAASILASPAQRALYGNVYNDTLGAVGIWKAGMFHVLIAVAVILTVIRHTRAEEETGRGELIDSTVVGRYAGLTAALVLAFGASALTGLLAFAGLLTADIPATGSLAFAAALTGSGLVFSAVAAVTAQLSASARFARGAAFSALAVAFALRAVGDAGSTSGGVLSWLSPLGWSLLIRPYADERWWVLLLHIGAAATLTMIAYRLLARRDVGAGLIAERPGPASAVSWLRGPLGLTWRLDRASVLLWTTGLCIYGLLIGSVAHGVGDEIGDSGPAHDMVVRLGGTGALEQAFIAVSFTMLGMVAAAFAVSLTLRLHTEEDNGHVEPLLAGSVSRNRWLASHLVITLAASALAMLAAGLITGVAYGIAAADLGAKLPESLATAAVQIPAVWLLGAATVALFGLVPRFTPIAWGLLVAFVSLYLLGSLSDSPQWMLDLTPFAHTPQVGGNGVASTPLVWLLIIDVTLITVGLVAFRRRDLR